MHRRINTSFDFLIENISYFLQLLEVNGVGMRGKSVHEVCQVLGALAGTLCVVVAPRAPAPAPRAPPAAPRVLHVRAHFDYDPEDDVYIPCRELGEFDPPLP